MSDWSLHYNLGVGYEGTGKLQESVAPRAREQTLGVIGVSRQVTVALLGAIPNACDHCF